jgi:hypothetical protein
LVSLVQRKVSDSSLIVSHWEKGEGHDMMETVGRLEELGIVLSQARVPSSVANVGLARAEESAEQLDAGNCQWDQLAAGNWEKAGGSHTL